MTRIIRSIHSWGTHFDERAEHFAFQHPYLALEVMFFLIPILILGAVLLSATAIMLPINLIFGWL